MTPVPLVALPPADVARLLVLACKHGLRGPDERPRGWGPTWGFDAACGFVERYARHCDRDQLAELARLLDGVEPIRLNSIGHACSRNQGWHRARREVQRLTDGPAVALAPPVERPGPYTTIPERR